MTEALSAETFMQKIIKQEHDRIQTAVIGILAGYRNADYQTAALILNAILGEFHTDTSLIAVVDMFEKRILDEVKAKDGDNLISQLAAEQRAIDDDIVPTPQGYVEASNTQAVDDALRTLP